MADTRISELADGTAPQDADAYPVERAGGNVKLLWSELKTALASRLAYVEFTGQVSITATTEGTAQSLVSAAALSFDGSTKVKIEVYIPSATIPGSNGLFVELFDGTTPLGWLWFASNPGSALNYGIGTLSRELTPSNGSHTYNVKAYNQNAGTVSVKAGAGGTGAYLPGFIRISTVS